MKAFYHLVATLLLVSVAVSILAPTALAQNSSLLHAPITGVVVQPQTNPGAMMPSESAQLRLAPGAVTQMQEGERPPVMIHGASWTFQPAPRLRVFRKNDIVTIRVDEITRVMAEGSAENRKRTLYEAILTDWIRLTEFRLRPDEQANGDPSIATESNSNYRAESTVESRESMTFNIAATVVDVRPNGTLLVEARKTIRVNDNLWETSLSGVCRVQDIAPDNVVLSKDLIDLEILKADRGHLRDGYKRGWFQRWFDRVQPF